MGGAYNRVPPAATAFVHRTERFLLEHVAIPADGTGADHAARWVRRSRACVASWASGGVNFPDPEIRDWADAYHGENLARLVRVKRHYDPDGFFRFPQSIPTGEKYEEDMDRHDVAEVLIRGTARLEPVDGVPDAFVEASRKMVPAEHFEGWEQGVRALYERTVLITVEPDRAKLLDFETTIPDAVEDLVRAREAGEAP